MYFTGCLAGAWLLGLTRYLDGNPGQGRVQCELTDTCKEQPCGPEKLDTFKQQLSFSGRSVVRNNIGTAARETVTMDVSHGAQRTPQRF